MACSTGCKTKDHKSFSECLRSKGTKVAYANMANNQDATAQKKWDRDLDYYKDATRQGVQPDGTQRQQVEDAMAISDATGSAFQA